MPTTAKSPAATARAGALGGLNALVLHGFTGVPLTVEPLADALAAAGAAVSVPLLPGHGDSAVPLDATRYADWLSAARDALGELRPRGERVLVCGLSMGGTLTLELGASEEDLAGLVVVNPLAEPAAPSLFELFDRLEADGVEAVPLAGADLKRNDLDYAGASTAPRAALRSLLDALGELAPRLASITAPTLCFTSRVDHVVPPTTGEFLERTVRAPFERVVLEESYHVATMDNDATLIGERTVAFASELVGASR